MTVEKMRAALAEVYPGGKWLRRLNVMEDRQIVAVYKTMEATGRLYRHPKRKPKEPGIRKAVQLSMFDPNYVAR